MDFRRESFDVMHTLLAGRVHSQGEEEFHKNLPFWFLQSVDHRGEEPCLSLHRDLPAHRPPTRCKPRQMQAGAALLVPQRTKGWEKVGKGEGEARLSNYLQALGAQKGPREEVAARSPDQMAMA